MFKKIIALALCVLTLALPLISCKKSDGAPDGMKLASLEGEPFLLYVPNAWSLNTKSGLSSAYSYANDKMIVTAHYHTPRDPEETLDAYMIACAESYKKTMKDFYLVTLAEAALLGGKDARRMEYTVTDAGKNHTCVQITTLHDGMFVTLSFYYLTEHRDVVAEEFEVIRAAFVLTARSEPAGDEIASGKNDAHKLYVPKSWICNSASGKTEAYYPESGKPNVTVTIYVPDESMTIDEYFASCEARYAEALSGYERLSDEERQVAGRRAMSYTYRASYDGVSFRIMQTVLSDGAAMYSVTYTALDDRFDAHFADVETMLDTFTFQ